MSVPRQPVAVGRLTAVPVMRPGSLGMLPGAACGPGQRRPHGASPFDLARRHRWWACEPAPIRRADTRSLSMSLCRSARPLYALAAVRSDLKTGGWWFRRCDRQRRASRSDRRPGIVIVQDVFLIQSLTSPVGVENENGRHLAPAAFGLRKKGRGSMSSPGPDASNTP